MSNVPGFDRSEQKPMRKSQAKLVPEVEREFDVFRAWVDAGGDEKATAETVGLTVAETRVLIRRGYKRWFQDLIGDLDLVRARHVVELDMLRGGVLPRAVDGNTQAVNDMLRIQKREAELLGLDAEKKVEGPQVIVVDTRMPWERSGGEPEIIDGEVFIPEDEP